MSRDTGFCKGCWRSIREIGAWRDLDDTHRLDIVRQLHQRRADAGVAPARKRNSRRG